VQYERMYYTNTQLELTTCAIVLDMNALHISDNPPDIDSSAQSDHQSEDGMQSSWVTWLQQV
jgi:hypothetical protein